MGVKRGPNGSKTQHFLTNDDSNMKISSNMLICMRNSMVALAFTVFQYFPPSGAPWGSDGGRTVVKSAKNCPFPPYWRIWPKSFLGYANPNEKFDDYIYFYYVLIFWPFLAILGSDGGQIWVKNGKNCPLPLIWRFWPKTFVGYANPHGKFDNGIYLYTTLIFWAFWGMMGVRRGPNRGQKCKVMPLSSIMGILI